MISKKTNNLTKT